MMTCCAFILVPFLVEFRGLRRTLRRLVPDTLGFEALSVASNSGLEAASTLRSRLPLSSRPTFERLLSSSPRPVGADLLRPRNLPHVAFSAPGNRCAAIDPAVLGNGKSVIIIRCLPSLVYEMAASSVDGRASAYIDRCILHRLHDKLDLFVREMSVKWQSHGAIGNFFRNREITPSIAEIKIVRLQM